METGSLGFYDPDFFTVGGGIPLLYAELKEAGLEPEWPSAVMTQKNGSMPKWVFLDRHAGVTMVGDQIVPPNEAELLPYEGYEPCPWKGFKYQKSAIICLAFEEGKSEIIVPCAFVEALGHAVVLGRDFVLYNAVWLEFDGWCSTRVHIIGRSLHCELVEKAYLRGKNYTRNTP